MVAIKGTSLSMTCVLYALDWHFGAFKEPRVLEAICKLEIRTLFFAEAAWDGCVKSGRLDP